MAGKTGPLVPLEVLRAAVIEASEASSLRRVAAHIGMSFSGLHSFLAGGTPFASTRAKLTRWYIGLAQSPTTTTVLSRTEFSIELLVEHLPDRQRAANDLIHCLVIATEDQGVPTPAWLSKLAKHAGRRKARHKRSPKKL